MCENCDILIILWQCQKWPGSHLALIWNWNSLWKACFLRRLQCTEYPTHVPVKVIFNRVIFKLWQNWHAQLKISRPCRFAIPPHWSSNFPLSHFSSESRMISHRHLGCTYYKNNWWHNHNHNNDVIMMIIMMMPSSPVLFPASRLDCSLTRWMEFWKHYAYHHHDNYGDHP